MTHDEIKATRRMVRDCEAFIQRSPGSKQRTELLERLNLTLAELDLELDERPENCGSGHCSCIECPYACNWTYDDDGFFKSACEEASFVPDLAVGHPEDFMKHCYGCGKPIHFVEPEQEEGDD